MPRIACLMMQKDEVLLLKPWLLHHGYLFGFENLYVYDNGSAEPVRATLHQFAACGVNVDVSRGTPDDFAAKGGIIGEKIDEFMDSGRYDIALAIDCDEFVAIGGQDGPSIARSAILAEIARIHTTGAICQTQTCFYNVPGYFDLFSRRPHLKSVIPIPKFRGLDHGFHKPALAPGETYGATVLSYLHMHHKPFAHLLEGVRNKLRPWVNPEDIEAVKSYQGVGRHLTKYLLMPPDDYYAWPDEGLVRFEGLAALLDLFNLRAGTLAGWEGGRPTAPAAFLRSSALAAMAEGRHQAAVTFWERFRALRPDDPDGYDYAAIACRAAGLPPNQVTGAALQRFPETFANAAWLREALANPATRR
jgi:hypothetical protein